MYYNHDQGESDKMWLLFNLKIVNMSVDDIGFEAPGIQIEDHDDLSRTYSAGIGKCATASSTRVIDVIVKIDTFTSCEYGEFLVITGETGTYITLVGGIIYDAYLLTIIKSLITNRAFNFIDVNNIANTPVYDGDPLTASNNDKHLEIYQRKHRTPKDQLVTH